MGVNVLQNIEGTPLSNRRALAVTVGKRWFALPDVPTVGETVPGFETQSGVRHRGATQHTIRGRQQAPSDDRGGVGRPENRSQLGGEPMPLSPTDFGKLIFDDTEKWAKVIKAENYRRPISDFCNNIDPKET